MDVLRYINLNPAHATPITSLRYVLSRATRSASKFKRMKNHQLLREIIDHINGYDLSKAVEKQVQVSNYPKLSSEIPDDFLEIEEAFPEDELELIYERFLPHLSEHEVFPCLGILGGNVVAIGCSEVNYGQVYYNDFDFQIFTLDENLSQFLSKLSD